MGKSIIVITSKMATNVVDKAEIHKGKCKSRTFKMIDKMSNTTK